MQRHIRPATLATILLAALTATLVAAGCGSQDTTEPQGAGRGAPPAGTTATSPATRSPRAASPAVPKQLAFHAKTLDGADFSGASLAGKPVVLWFWAPWCTICRAEAEGVANVAKRLQGTVTFLGVAGRDSEPAMRRFVADTKTGSFPHLADTDGRLWASFGVTSQPAFAFVHPDGRIETVGGSLPEDDLAAKAAALAA
jgi:thiol-disulfide isomerase/thioredoxin